MGDSTISDGVVINNHGVAGRPSKIVVERYNHIGRDVIIDSCFGVNIGEHVMIAARCQIIDFDHGHATRSIPMGQQAAVGGIVHIHRDVWIGAGTLILKNVNIGEGAVVGAGSVVTKNVPPFEIWAGVPARKISERPNIN